MSCPMSSRGPEGGPWVSSVALSGFSAQRTPITQRSNGRHGSASSAPGYRRHGHASGVPGYWGFRAYPGLRGVGAFGPTPPRDLLAHSPATAADGVAARISALGTWRASAAVSPVWAR